MLHRRNFLPRALVVLAGLTMHAGVAAPAQQLAQADRGPRFLRHVTRAEPPVEVDMNATPVLRRRVALTQPAATLGQILRAIRRQVGLKFIYSADVIPADRVIGLRADSITVAAALTEILLDARVDVVFYSAAEAGLVRRDPPRLGAIIGQVTDERTAAPIPGATVTIDLLSLAATAGSDGQYRLEEVPAATYTVQARYIGYAPASRSVTVAGEDEVTVDFALQRSAQRLDEVVTTGTVVPTEVKALPTPITVITAEDISRQQPRRVDQLLRQMVPSSFGFEFAGSPEAMQVSARGASGFTSGSGLKIYVDGIEVANRATMAVDPNSIERIEVIRGPEAAAIYGSDAIGGVMQIFTKKGGGTVGRPQVGAQAMLGTMQNPYLEGSSALRQEYQASIRGGGLTASYHFGAGYMHQGDWLPEGAASAPSVFGGVHYVLGPLTVDVSARYYSNTHGSPANPLTVQTGSLNASKPQYRRNQYAMETYGAHITYQPSDWWRHGLTVGVDRYTMDSRNTQPRLLTPADTLLGLSVTSRQKPSVAYNTSVTVPLSSSMVISATAGVDHYRYFNNFSSTTGALNTSGTIRLAPDRTWTQTRDVTTNTGYFAQAQLNIHEALFVTGALRADQNSAFSDGVGSPLAPRGGIAYVHQLGSTTLKLRASYGEAIRPPLPDWGSSIVTPTFIRLANPLLVPERQLGGDVGVDVALGAEASVNVTYYRQSARDLIQAIFLPPTEGISTHQFQNVGRVRNSGVEIEGRLNLSGVELRGQYAITRSVVQELGPGYAGDLVPGDHMLGVPRSSAGASVAVSPLRSTSVTAGFTYAGPRTNYNTLAQLRCSAQTGPCQPSLRGYWMDYPAAVRANLSATQQLTPTLTGVLAVENLTNSSTPEGNNGILGVGRIGSLGIRWQW